jgi:hypothetical protein
MSGETVSLLDRTATDCALCRRSVLVGEPLTPYLDPRTDRRSAVCELCRDRAVERGWSVCGAPVRRRGSTRLRVETMPATRPAREPDGPASSPKLLAPQAAILERAIGLDARPAPAAPGAPNPSPALLARVRSQDAELLRLRRDLDPARRAEEQRRLERQAAEIRELREALREREAQVQRLQHARHAETSPMRMSGFALDALNQSAELERMARIARTLGDPVVNVHDEGAGIPRRVRITLSWDIAWYEFTVKLDIGAGRASVHETGTGGDPSVLPLERRRANAAWSGSGLKLS